MKQGKLVVLLMLLQGVCAVFFVFDILATLLGLRATPISWQTRELLEIGAAIGLVLGVILGWIALRRSLNRSRRAEESLRTVRREFRDHLEQTFVSWGLTPAEQDVALFSLQGFSIFLFKGFLSVKWRVYATVRKVRSRRKATLFIAKLA